MARKLAHESDSGSDPDDGESGRGTVTTGRRDCLKLGGAAVATMVSVTGGVAAADAGSADDDGRRLVISGAGDVSGYEVTVDGSLTPADGSDAAADVSGHSAEGVVGAERREYRFTGDVRAIRVEEGATVHVEGAAVGGD